MFEILFLSSLFTVIAAYYTIRGERKRRLKAKTELEEFERMNPVKKKENE